MDYIAQLAKTRLQALKPDLPADDDLIRVVSDDYVQAILNYINDDDLPSALVNLAVRLVADHVAGVLESGGNAGDIPANVASVRQGDLSVTFREGGYSHDAESVILSTGVREQLQSYRKLAWGRGVGRRRNRTLGGGFNVKYF